MFLFFLSLWTPTPPLRSRPVSPSSCSSYSSHIHKLLHSQYIRYLRSPRQALSRFPCCHYIRKCFHKRSPLLAEDQGESSCKFSDAIHKVQVESNDWTPCPFRKRFFREFSFWQSTCTTKCLNLRRGICLVRSKPQFFCLFSLDELHSTISLDHRVYWYLTSFIQAGTVFQLLLQCLYTWFRGTFNWFGKYTWLCR